MFDVELPEQVRCLSFHSPYGQLILDGIKTIETRRHTRLAEGWCVIHVAQHVNRKAVDMMLAMELTLPIAVKSYVTPRGKGYASLAAGQLIGLVWVGAPMLFFDRHSDDACVWPKPGDPPLFAYPLSRARKFTTPVVGVRGHQGPWYVPRADVLRALGDAA